MIEKILDEFNLKYQWRAVKIAYYRMKIAKYEYKIKKLEAPTGGKPQ